MLQVGTLLHIEILALRLRHFRKHFAENDISQCDVFGTSNDAIEVEPHDAQILQLKVLYLLVLEEVIAEGRPSVVKSVDVQVELPIEDVVEHPLVVVREVVVQVNMHYVRKLDDLAVSCWIHETRPEIIGDFSDGAEPVDFCLNEKLECLGQPPHHKEVVLEVEVAEYYIEDLLTDQRRVRWLPRVLLFVQKYFL